MKLEPTVLPGRPPNMVTEDEAVKPPGPKGLHMLKALWRFQREPLNTLSQITQDYGDIVVYRFGPFPVVLLNHPDAVYRVLIENHQNYGKQHSPFYKMLRHFLGQGLLTSDGDFWLRQRRLAQPAFQRRRIEAMGPIITSCTEDMVQGWRQLRSGQRIDADQEMMHLTLRIVGLLLFSQDLSATGSAVGAALDELQVQMGERFSALVPLPPVLPTARDQRFRQARENLSEMAMRIVLERRRDPDPPTDLLSSLLEASESGEAMSDLQIRDELVTFLLAGHETTSNTLTWAFYLLSLHPDQRRRLEADLDEESPPGKSFCDRAILETLRLYPPAWVYGRRSYKADQVLGYSIRPNQDVTISPYVLHRHPEFWPNPEGFDPDRFLHDIPRSTFVPFAAGPRQCIGNHFALLESRLILSAIAKQVRLNVVGGTQALPEALITLRPKGGLPVTLEFREREGQLAKA